MAAAAAGPLAYDSYSYMYHADLYRVTGDTGAARRAGANAVATLAPREMRAGQLSRCGKRMRAAGYSSHALARGS